MLEQVSALRDKTFAANKPLYKIRCFVFLSPRATWWYHKLKLAKISTTTNQVALCNQNKLCIKCNSMPVGKTKLLTLNVIDWKRSQQLLPKSAWFKAKKKQSNLLFTPASAQNESCWFVSAVGAGQPHSVPHNSGNRTALCHLSTANSIRRRPQRAEEASVACVTQSIWSLSLCYVSNTNTVSSRPPLPLQLQSHMSAVAKQMARVLHSS